MIKIIIVEDNRLARRALTEKLSQFSEIDIAAVAENGKEGIHVAEKNPDVHLIFMDIEMPVMNGIEATFEIKKRFPQIKIVMITVYDDDDHIFRAIQSGADSYILKETKGEKIFETITDTLAGGAVMSPSIAVKTLQILRKKNIPENKNHEEQHVLSVRESEILDLLSEGKTNRTIAEKLFISPFTVKRHIENIYQKLQAHNRTDLLQKAREQNLL